MRSYSLFTIILLCLAIVVLDMLTFYWLLSLTKLLTSELLKTIIHILFWTFTAGLVISIIILKVRLDDINPRRKHLLVSSLYGLTVSSFIPKLIFTIIISILFFTNYVFSETESLIVIPIVGLFSGILPFSAILFGIFRSLYRFKIEHVRLTSELLPMAFDRLRIVHISDLHLGSFNYRYHILDRAINSINHLKPDLIIFTGDLVNNFAWELRGWEKVFNNLNGNARKYAVLGNHDYGDYSSWANSQEKQGNFESIKDFFKAINFKLLMNASDRVSRDEDNIAIIGVENWGNPPFKQYGDLDKSMTDVKDVPFKILLSHDPSHWSEEVINDTDIFLTLSGHTHGMQIGFQYKRMNWSPIKYKYKHWGGLYQEGKHYLYVNRGLGWLGFPGRLGMRPEITLIELRSKSQSA
ncbi:MAG: metallophosphoesterase [Flavobacteriaceae bacterium]|nr:metallophosphoesterase [Flavobacteriaceae bacterium]